jgi:hypothetical protein
VNWPRWIQLYFPPIQRRLQREAQQAFNVVPKPVRLRLFGPRPLWQAASPHAMVGYLRATKWNPYRPK